MRVLARTNRESVGRKKDGRPDDPGVKGGQRIDERVGLYPTGRIQLVAV